MCAPVLLSIPALGVQECCYFTLKKSKPIQLNCGPPVPPLLFPVNRCLKACSTSESGLFLLDFYLLVRPVVKIGQLLALPRAMLK